LPVSGAAQDATLQVNCAIGTVPLDHQLEGVRLTIEGSGVQFDEEVSGVTLFLLLRPQLGMGPNAGAPRVGASAPPEDVRQ